jgi:hypothetical protein
MVLEKLPEGTFSTETSGKDSCPYLCCYAFSCLSEVNELVYRHPLCGGVEGHLVVRQPLPVGEARNCLYVLDSTIDNRQPTKYESYLCEIPPPLPSRSVQIRRSDYVQSNQVNVAIETETIQDKCGSRILMTYKWRPRSEHVRGQAEEAGYAKTALISYLI